VSDPTLVSYSREAFGLGHLSRQLALAEALLAAWPELRQLIVTGSPAPHLFEFPEPVEYIKIPGLHRTATLEFESRLLPLPFAAISALRGEIILAAARHLVPDLLLIDTFLNDNPEIQPTLQELRRVGKTRFVLGLRDIVYEAPLTRRLWRASRTYQQLEEWFDLILVYGERDLFDVAVEYDMPPSIAGRVRYTGYLSRRGGGRPAAEVRGELPLRSERLVLVTAGGGGDGHAVMRAHLEALRRWPEAAAFDTLLVTGPLMPADQRRELAAQAAELPGVHFHSALRNLVDYMAASDAVVSMGGYNTVAETLACRKPALVVPRAMPHQEQVLRARMLSEHGYLRWLHPDDLTPRRLLEEVQQLLERPPRPARPHTPARPAALAAEFRALLEGTGGRVPESGPC
jgi:predicted glycosyltransferase